METLRGHGAPSMARACVTPTQEEYKMNTKITATGGGVQSSRKLLAALAVLAVAFVVLAAVPSVAADGTTVSDESGFWTKESGKETNAYGAKITTEETNVTVVTLQSNVVLEKPVVLAGNTSYKVVLNGYTISKSVGNTIFYMPNDGSKLTIDGNKAGSSIVGNDMIVNAFDCVANLEVVVNGGTYTGDWPFVIGPKGSNGTAKVEFTDATINAKTAGIWMSYGQMDQALIKNCTINSDNIGIYCATFGGNISERDVDSSKNVKSTAAAVFYNNKVTAENTALEIKSGSVEIIGGKYTSNNYEADASHVGSSGSGAGVATIVINNKYCGSGNANGVSVNIADAEISNTGNTKAPVLVITAPGVSGKDVSLTMDKNYGVEIGLGAKSTASGATASKMSATVTDAISISNLSNESANGAYVSFIGKEVRFTDGSVTVGTNTIPKEYTYVVDGATLAVSGAVTGEGSFSVAAGSVSFKDGGSITIAGVKADTVTTPSGEKATTTTVVTDAIKNAASGTDSLIISGVGTESTPGTNAIDMAAVQKAADEKGIKTLILNGAEGGAKAVGDIALNEGSSIAINNIAYTGTVSNGDSKVAATGLTGNYSLTYGSVSINGTVTAGSATIEGDIDISGTVSGDVVLTVLEGKKANVSIGNLTVDAGKSLTILGDAAVANAEGTILTVKGTLDLSNEKVVSSVSAVAEGSSVFVKGDVDLTVKEDAVVGGEIFGTVAVEDDATINAKMNLESLTVSGTLTIGSDITVKNLVVEEGASISGGKKIAVSGQAEIYGTVAGTVSVGANAYVTVDAGLEAVPTGSTANTVTTIDNKGTVVVKGGAVIGTLTNEKTVRVYVAKIADGTNASTGTIYLMDQKAQVAVSGEGKIDVSAVTETLEIAGSIAPGKDTEKTNYPAYQTVIVTKDTVVKKGADVTINGSFIVNEGVTLTVEEGAKITVTSVTGSFQNNGAVVSEGEIVVTGNSKFANNGTLSLACETVDTHDELKVENGAIFENVGELSVGEDSTVAVSTTSPAGTFKNSGKVSVEGAFDGKISNTGSVIIASEKDQTITVDNADVSATVEVSKMKGTLIVTDIGMADTKKKINAGDNKIVIATTGTTKSTISGISIAEATYKPTSDAKTYDVKMLVSGSVSASDVTDGITQTINVEKGIIEVSGEMTVGKNVAFTQTAGTFTVSGTMVFAKDFTATVTPAKMFVGKLVVTGTLSSVAKELTYTTFVGASYKVAGSGSVDTVFYYTGIEAAIAAADGTKVKEISISAGTSDDKSEIAADATIVKDVTAKLKGELSVKKGATLTVADGAKLKQDGTAKIVVSGKLVIENAKTASVTGIVIDSEVVAVEGDRQVYTSLATAIADAGENVVTIKLSKAAKISEDLVIPANITVDTNDTSGVTVSKNVTLEIDGTLLLKGAAKLTLEKATGTEDKDAKAVLNGYIKAGTETGLQADVAGAYYTVGDHEYYMVCGVAKAPEAVLTADDLTIAIYKGLSQDIAFVGAADKTVKISVHGDVKASVTLSYAVLTVQDGKIAGKIAGANGSVQFKDATAKILVATASVADDVETLVIAGTVDAQAGADKEPSVVFDGAVAVKGAIVKIDATVVGNLTVSGTESFADVVVEGTLEVDNKAKLTVKNLEIFGAVAVADKNDKGDAAGELKADLIYIGISEKAVTGVVGADASLTAPAEKVAYGTMFVAPAGKVSADLVKDVKSTAYYVDDALYLTAYAGDAPELISFVEYVDKTAKVGEWQVDGDDVSATAKIGSVEKVVLDLDYDVYKVRIVGDAGVGSVAINGVLFLKTGNGFEFPAKLKAGTYTVTVSAAADYDISGIKLSDSEGKDLSMKITLAGDFNEANENIYYLSGSVPAVTPTPDPTPIIIKDDSDDMSLTDILLIVLVVLIVIMAAIVALRMMRS